MNWHLTAASTGEPPETVLVTPQRAGWSFSGLCVVDLPPGGSYARGADDFEAVVLPLAGSCVVESDDGKAELAGRPGVFAAVSDCAYVPCASGLLLTSAEGGRFALACARARQRLPFRHVRAGDVAVELRGAGSCSRQVNNFAMPGVLDADRLIACEVLTPAGN